MSRETKGRSPFIVLASGDDLSVLAEAGGQRPVRGLPAADPDRPEEERVTRTDAEGDPRGPSDA
ncbi:MAG: hypothetical protein AB7V62_11035 [Thermoleophilia bacterium]